MHVVGVGKWARWGVFTFILAFCLSLFTSTEAEARRRGGRGRKGGARKVKAGKRRGGKRRAGRRGGRRGGRRAGGRGRGGIQSIPANGNVNANQGPQDFGPASINPDALGIRVVDGFDRLGRSQDGTFFELNPGVAAAGGVVDPSTGVRQPIVSAGRSLVSGAMGQLSPEAEIQIRAFNRGEIPSQVGSTGGITQVRSLRQR